MGGGLLQDFQKGVLRFLGHLLHVRENIDLYRALIGQHKGAAADFPNLVHAERAAFALSTVEHQVGVAVFQGHAAGGAVAAGKRLSGILAQDGRRQLKGHRLFAAPCLTLQQQGMRQTPARKIADERLQNGCVTLCAAAITFKGVLRLFHR